MTTSPTPHPPVASRDQWLVERKKLLAHEKELTKHRDRVNAKRIFRLMKKYGLLLQPYTGRRRARKHGDSVPLIE